MAFAKTARAVITNPHADPAIWRGLRKSASISPSRSVSDQASEILGGPLDPGRYLITHCTIVASVDVRVVPGIKTGQIKTGAKTVDRRWSDYLITPETDRYINGNYDSFSRGVILKSYRSFIGASNYQEHVQIAAQEKGRVVDAVARDIGDSVYVDILVATDRKHDHLISQIESGALTTLSMGCSTECTQCTKCGHVAVDETQLCDCVKYEKGNYFIDDHGVRRRVAELCGHESIKESGGVTFIEASWVAVPAFKGAVMRNILIPSDGASKQAQEILARPPADWSGLPKARKAASATHLGFDFDPDASGGTEEAPVAPDAAAAPAKDPLADAEEKLYLSVRDRVVKRIEDSLALKDAPPAQGLPNGSASTNENLTKMAYTKALVQVVRVARSNADLVSRLHAVNTDFGVLVPNDVYWAASKVGHYTEHANGKAFIAACNKFAGRNISPAEVRVITRIGSLLARRARLGSGD